MDVSRSPSSLSALFATRTSAQAALGAPVVLAPLLSLVREMSTVLVPIQPRPDFRVDLERSLVAAARQQNAQAALGTLPQPRRDVVWRQDIRGGRIAIGAAAVGSAVSLVGLVAYMLHRRGDRAA